MKKDKLRAIYSWLVHNFNRRDCCKLRRELTLPILCSFININCETIRGYRKSGNFVPGDNLSELYRHQWYLVTYDDSKGFIDLEAASTEPYGIDFYFLTKPERLIKSHLPENCDNQLLSRKINEETFRNSVRVWPAKYALSIKSLEPNDDMGSHKIRNGKFSVRLRARHQSLSFTLLEQGIKGEKRIDEYVDHRISNIEEEEVFDLLLPSKARYILTIVVHEEDDQLPVQQYSIDYK